MRLVHASSEPKRLALVPVPFSVDLPAFGGISDVARAPGNHLVVLDPAGPVVVVLDSTGLERARFGRDGDGPGEFGAGGLTTVVVVGDTIVVPDVFNQRVSFFDLDGELLRDFPFTTEAGFALDWQLDPDGSFIFRRLSSPQRLEALDRSGEIRKLLTDSWLLGLPSEAGLLTPLPLWCVLPDGRLATARSDRYAVTVGDRTSPSAILSGDVGERPLGDAELAHVYELVRRSLAQRMRAEVDLATAREMAQQMPLPEAAPLLAGILCSEDGEVWVQHSLPVEQMKPTITRVGSPEGWRSSVWDVFRIDAGQALRAEIPGEAQFTRVTEEWAVGYTVGELGQEQPARWRRE